jgi:hypothetical protein
MSHEEELIKAFILPQRRDRYLSFIKTSKRRDKYIDRLDHFCDLDPRYAKLIPPKNQTAIQIEIILRNKKKFAI